MELKELIKIASDVYPDDAVQRCFNKDPKDPVDDTLALFVARKLEETFDEAVSDGDQLKEAIRVMETACDELGDVVDALEAEHVMRS